MTTHLSKARGASALGLLLAVLGAAPAQAYCSNGGTECSNGRCCASATPVCVANDKCCARDYPNLCSDNAHCAKTAQLCECYVRGEDVCGTGCMPKGAVCCADGTFCGANQECGCGGCVQPGSVCCAGGKTCPSGKECRCNGCVDPGAVCCSGDTVCQAGTECSCGGCVQPGATCCGTGACAAGTECCDNKCTPSGTVCCGMGLYCPATTVCSGASQCRKSGQTTTSACPSGYPILCTGGYCCPSGTTCAGNNLCNAAVPVTSNNTPATYPTAAPLLSNGRVTDGGVGTVPELKWGCQATPGSAGLWLLAALASLLLRRRRRWRGGTVAVVLLLLLPLAARAQGASRSGAPTGKDACTEGRVKGVDSAGHCCWPDQAWSNLRNTCVGIPTCPQGMTSQGETCTVACPQGQAVGPDTAGHCCWGAQVWSSSRALCVGIPQCPQGMRAEGESCVVACPEGQLVAADTAGNCCWPNQVWSNSRMACMGTPTCPSGFVAAGAECVRQQAVAPAPAPVPVAAPAPAPAPGPAPVATPDDGAPVPIAEGAPVPVPEAAAPVPLSDAAPQRRTEVSESSEDPPEIRPSRWVLGVDGLIDLSSGRFGFRLRTDFPLAHMRSPPAIGLGLGFLTPTATGADRNNAWALPAEVAFSWRIGLLDPPKLFLVPRAGLVGFLMAGTASVAFGLKVELGLGVRFSFGGSFGVSAGIDLLIPAVGGGFVSLLAIGITV